MRSVRVSVPCSTSNLGPAFDCLGLALSLRNELTLEIHDGPAETVVEIEGEGSRTLSRGADNLMVRAASSVLAGRGGARMVFKAKNRIPLARGLGSSAAAIVAGLYAANELIGGPLDAGQLFEYAVVMEGHPDNVAPALMGGLVATLRQDNKASAFPLKPHPDLRAVVCVPDFELATSAARAVLPPTLLREQAVANIGRSLLLGVALESGRWDWLPAAMEDQLHQPYRAPLVKGLADVLRAARQAGSCGAALSGAGPSVLALCPASAPLEAIGRAMTAAFAAQGIGSRHLPLTVETQGARTEP
jgi:homoserine kinase